MGFDLKATGGDPLAALGGTLAGRGAPETGRGGVTTARRYEAASPALPQAFSTASSS